MGLHAVKKGTLLGFFWIFFCFLFYFSHCLFFWFFVAGLSTHFFLLVFLHSLFFLSSLRFPSPQAVPSQWSFSPFLFWFFCGVMKVGLHTVILIVRFCLYSGWSRKYFAVMLFPANFDARSFEGSWTSQVA